MRVPAVRGTIERRILVNFRTDSAVMARVLPAPFRPKLQEGFAIGGVCLIRLAGIRPPLVPAALGAGSENAAHRIAVQWDDNGVTREGVYIPRRDTSSRLNTIIGGRLFPGVHHPARFEVTEDNHRYRVVMESNDRDVRVLVDGTVTSALPAASVFGSLASASTFFERGSLGYSATGRKGTFDGLELCSRSWRVEPLAINAVTSSFFEDRRRFPDGTVEFDCALLMRDIAHEWRAREPLCVGPAAA